MVYSVNSTITVISLYCRAVREGLGFNVDYFDWLIFDFTNLLMFCKVYIDFAEAGDGDATRVARVNVHG